MSIRASILPRDDLLAAVSALMERITSHNTASTPNGLAGDLVSEVSMVTVELSCDCFDLISLCFDPAVDLVDMVAFGSPIVRLQSLSIQVDRAMAIDSMLIELKYPVNMTISTLILAIIS